MKKFTATIYSDFFLTNLQVHYKRDWVKYSAVSDFFGGGGGTVLVFLSVFVGVGGVSNNLPFNKESPPGYRQGAAGTSPRRQRSTESAAGGAGGGTESSPGKYPAGRRDPRQKK